MHNQPTPFDYQVTDTTKQYFKRSTRWNLPTLGIFIEVSTLTSKKMVHINQAWYSTKCYVGTLNPDRRLRPLEGFSAMTGCTDDLTIPAADHAFFVQTLSVLWETKDPDLLKSIKATLHDCYVVY